jgi:hypothetical protein
VHPEPDLLRIVPMRRLLLLAGWLVALPCLAGQETPYVPARDDLVLQTVASISDPRVRAFGALRSALNQDPHDVSRAVKLSEAYLDYGRDTGDARYLGRAEAVIAPWLGDSPAPIPALLVHATILQSRHYFVEARAQLRSILGRDSVAGVSGHRIERGQAGTWDQWIRRCQQPGAGLAGRAHITVHLRDGGKSQPRLRK